ncbi:hypothetical protein JAG49_003904 [Morganella morganii]|nr:hypothetical protein [Morganella morganii]
MNPEQKRLTERLLEVPQMRSGQMITLLTIWLEAESEGDIANMVGISLDYVRRVQEQLSAVMGENNHG